MALNKLPDIDIDFPHDRKDDVIDLIFEKYGVEHAAVVGGFSTYQSRSALGDVGKILGVSEGEIRRITKQLPHFTSPADLRAAIRSSPECKDLPLDEEPYSTALEMAGFLDGFPRNPKMHPCGVVVSREPMHHLTACFVSDKGYFTTHDDMDAVESRGLIKMDILAQGGLAVMRDALTALERRGITVDLLKLEPWTDPEIWELIASGGARAVHHIESPAMISLCVMTDVHDIDTLIGIVSVIRPGAANQNAKLEFTRRYQGISPTHYAHPSLEPCLKCSFGLIIYEEQVLQICDAFAGLPPGKADVLRRALGKENTSVIEEIHKEFIQCATREGRTDQQIIDVWNLVSSFRGYAFCKAHSTAYAIEAYQSAWLKLHHPAETMAAVLSNGKGFYAPLVYVLECYRLGIPLLRPTVNAPGPQFEVEYFEGSAKIRIPIRYIKGLTDTTHQSILREGAIDPFSSLNDFFLRVKPLPEEMDSLVRVGAFDEFGKSRTIQFWELRFLLGSSDPADPRQGLLFAPTSDPRLERLPLEEPSQSQRWIWEIELLGFPAEAHPLEPYREIDWNSYCTVARLKQFIGQEITLCGLIVEGRTFSQQNGEPMKFLTLADKTGMIETELFATTYKTYGLATVRYPVLEITAKVEPFDNGKGQTLRVLRAGKPREIGHSEPLCLPRASAHCVAQASSPEGSRGVSPRSSSERELLFPAPISNHNSEL